MLMKSYSPATINYDDEIAVRMSRLVIVLRKNGYKGITKTFIINSLSNHILNIYDKKGHGLKAVGKLIKKDYNEYMDARKK